MTLARASIFFTFLLAQACSSAPLPPPAETRVTPRPPATSNKIRPAPVAEHGPDRFAIAAENATAVEVARQVLEDGGSAVDAAVAGILVGCAAHAGSCSLGSGGAAMLWDPKLDKPIFVDFRETAPLGVKPSDYASKSPGAKRRGVMVGVPGLVAGLWELHQRGGKLAWSAVVARAADAVERGIPMSAYMAQLLEWNTKWLREDEDAAKLFGAASAKDRVGEKMENPALAKTLRTIAERGRDGFYTGPIATEIVAAARATAGRISIEDLSRYKVVVREPLRVAWSGHDVWLAPPPSGAGVTIAQVLTMFGRDDLRALEQGSAPLVHALAEGLRASYVDRGSFVGDPDYFRSDVGTLLDAAKLKARRAKLDMQTTTLPRIPSIADSGTFHLDVVDEQGQAVSITATLTSMFGSKIVSKGGFALNDALSDFSIDEYGSRTFTKGANAVKGGARSVSSLCPTLVSKDGHLVAALGGSGGLRGATGVLEVLVARFAFDQPLPEAVAAPRFHVTSSGALKLDAGLAGLAPDLVARGEVVDAKGDAFGAVTAVGVSVKGDRTLVPVFDPRKGGAVTIGRGHRESGVTHSKAGP